MFEKGKKNGCSKMKKETGCTKFFIIVLSW